MAKRKTIDPKHVNGRRLAVGVDPSMNRTAFAVWDLDEATFVVFATYEYVAARKKGIMISREASYAKFYVEDSSQHRFIYGRWLKEWNRIRNEGKQAFSKWLGQVNSHAMAVGKNQATGQLLIKEWSAAGMSVNPVAPTTEKLKAPAFNALTSCKLKTNQDERDSGMLVFGL